MHVIKSDSVKLNWMHKDVLVSPVCLSTRKGSSALCCDCQEFSKISDCHSLISQALWKSVQGYSGVSVDTEQTLQVQVVCLGITHFNNLPAWCI